MEAYEYSALSKPRAVRLLELPEGKDKRPDEPIECRLFEATLDDCPAYEALSYCWSSATVTQYNNPRIIIDGHFLDVTPNLYAGFLELRKRKRMLWIDAICIDQQNVAERNEQVRHMRLIYGKASTVLVWLGEASESNSLSLAAAQYMEQSFQKFVEERGTTVEKSSALPDEDSMSFSRLVEEFGALVVKEFIGNDQPVGTALVDLRDIFEKDWVSRTWTVQEVVVAAHVIVLCGDWSFTWDSFITIMAIYQRAGLHYCAFHLQSETTQFSIIRIVMISTVQRRYRARKEEDIMLDPLPANMLAFRRHHATDPRDKCFAFQGISSGVPQDVAFLPNYDPDNTVENVYKSTAVHYLREGHAHLLHCVLNPPDPTLPELKLPSWVPDWRIGAATPHLEPGILKFGQFNASLGSGNEISFSSDENVLLVPGRPTCAISVTGEHLRFNEEWKSTIDAAIENSQNKGSLDIRIQVDKRLFGLIHRVLLDFHVHMVSACSEPGYYVTGEPIEEAVGRTFCCDRELLLQTFSLAMGYRREFCVGQEARPTSGSRMLECFHTLDLQRSREEVDIMSTVAAWVKSYKWCITDRGFAGWVPPCAENGDQIVILHGMNTPFVLRACGEGGYTLVGDCYIHGIMEGEAMDDEKYPAQVFHLV